MTGVVELLELKFEFGLGNETKRKRQNVIESNFVGVFSNYFDLVSLLFEVVTTNSVVNFVENDFETTKILEALSMENFELN